MRSVKNEDVLHPALVADSAPSPVTGPLPSVADSSDRPKLSSIVIDKDTGIERIAQGKAVMDVVTHQAVKLYDDPMVRLAQFFPGVPPAVREKHRLDNFYSTLEIPELLEKFEKACLEENGDELPEHPQVRDEALDFVLANRDLLGSRLKKLLGRLKLRHQSLEKVDKAKFYRDLWKHFCTLEDSVSAPFRQLILDSEGIIGPNFGNLELQSFLKGSLVARCAHYVTLKAMVSHWEKKVRDAEFVESTPQTKQNFMQVLCTGDPKRYLPDPPIIFRLEECVKVCGMAQKMAKTFVETPELFDDLPVELRFLEKALYIQGGTEVRRFTVEEFCPKEEITPEALREGLRRLDTQLSNLQIDPYGDFKNVVGRLCEALSVGTDEERDPYADYLYNLSKDGPGYFQTYTFDHDVNSLVRFLDNAKTIEDGGMGTDIDDIAGQLGSEFTAMFKNKKEDSMTAAYRPPPKRAEGRPHMAGWLDLLGDYEKPKKEDKLESDNWREI